METGYLKIFMQAGSVFGRRSDKDSVVVIQGANLALDMAW
jgi:hypothetical protein